MTKLQSLMTLTLDPLWAGPWRPPISRGCSGRWGHLLFSGHSWGHLYVSGNCAKWALMPFWLLGKPELDTVLINSVYGGGREWARGY